MSNNAVLIGLDITRVRDNYKTGERTVFGRELVIRQAQDWRGLERLVDFGFFDDVLGCFGLLSNALSFSDEATMPNSLRSFWIVTS